MKVIGRRSRRTGDKVYFVIGASGKPIGDLHRSKSAAFKALREHEAKLAARRTREEIEEDRDAIVGVIASGFDMSADEIAGKLGVQPDKLKGDLEALVREGTITKRIRRTHVAAGGHAAAAFHGAAGRTLKRAHYSIA